MFQEKYEALNPPIPTAERALWSRWDVLDHVTLYGADTDVTAVLETLAYVKPAQLRLEEIFDDLTAEDDPVAADWQALGQMAPGQIARAWRVARQLTTIRLHPGAVSWVVDVRHAETIAVLRREVAAWSRTLRSCASR